MKMRMIAFLLALVLLVPALALGESTPLPYGLAMGMDKDGVYAAFAADETLAALTPDVSEYSGAAEYTFENVPIAGTDINATSLSVQVDQNNSAKADRLSGISFVISPAENSIAAFRTMLTALMQTLGAPQNDPFEEDAAELYVEWGTLDASWTFADVRVSLTLNRMYEESITLQYSSRINYDKADLAQE